MYTPEGTRHATSVNVQLLRLRRDLRRRARFGETLWISPPNSAGAEMACLRKWHVWCRLNADARRLPMSELGSELGHVRC